MNIVAFCTKVLLILKRCPTSVAYNNSFALQVSARQSQRENGYIETIQLLSATFELYAWDWAWGVT